MFPRWHSFGVLVIVTFANGQENNVCKSFGDYYAMKDNPNCYYNYAIGKLVPEIITLLGLPFEEHKVTTEDGYILTMHRIPNTNHPLKQKTVIFLQHGLLASSANYVALRNDSLSFTLANNGYDVWMGNYRGNQYSEEHVSMNAYNHKFWDYSVDELGTKDMPAMLNYVNNITKANGNMVYIGQSLGTTIALTFAADMPDVAKRLVKLFIFMAPIHLLQNLAGPFATLRPFAGMIYNIVKNMDLIRITSDGRAINPLVKLICLETPRLLEVCYNGMRLIFGENTTFLPDMLPLVLDQVTGSSLKVFKHLADFTTTFTKFDYGLNNIFMYNQMLPPEYDLQKITVPIYVMTSAGDRLSPMKDAYNLYKHLPTWIRYGIYQVPSSKFGHIDYLFGTEAKTLINDHIISILSKLV